MPDVNMSKAQVKDSLNLYHLKFSEIAHPDAKLKSTITLLNFKQEGFEGMLMVDFDAVDSVALITFVVSDQTEEGYKKICAAAEKKYGIGEKSTMPDSHGEMWNLGWHMVSVAYTEEQKQLALMDIAPQRIAQANGIDASGYDDEAASQAYENGDFATSRKLAEPAANRGIARAQFIMGMLYLGGKGVDHQDDAQAAKWFTKASDQGNTYGQLLLASLYRNGHGVAKDTVKAWQLLMQSADAGNGFAEDQVGMQLLSNSTKQKEAVHFFALAAEQGVDNSQFQLGYCYFNGTGVEKDVKQAVEWFEKAVAQQNTRAMGMLVPIYMGGEEGVPKNLARAYALAHLAAEMDPIQAATSGKAITEAYANEDEVTSGKRMMEELKNMWDPNKNH